jgi:hypothetical protein
MKGKINKNQVALTIVLFSIGFTSGKLVEWGYFVIVNEIRIIEAFTLFVTIGLAFYVTYILEKEMQDVRIIKELYLAKISELETMLNSFENLIECTNISYQKINNRIHFCRIKKNSIFSNVEDNFKKIQSEEFDIFKKEITNKMNSLKRLLTETSPVLNQNSEISIKKGIVTYSSNRIIEICTDINTINENLFKMKVRINNL